MKNISKNLLLIGIGALLSFSVLSAFAMDSVPLLPKDVAGNSDQYLTQKAAMVIALEKAGSGYEVVSIEFDIDDDDNVEFDIKMISDEYLIEAEIDAMNGRVLEWEVRARFNTSQNNQHSVPYISREQAIDIALSAVGSGFIVVSVEFDHDDDDDVEYEVKLKSDTMKAEVEIDARSGKVLELDKELIQKTNQTTNNQTYISREQAINIALSAVGSGFTVVSVEFDHDDDDDVEYEVKLKSDTMKVEVEIDARSGKVLELDKEAISIVDSQTNTAQTYISKERAIEIARTKVGSARLEEIEFEDDDFPPHYELKFEYGDIEYELKIHAVTGVILEFEIDD